MKIGDKVTYWLDNKLWDCEIIDIEENWVKAEWFPGPQFKWMLKVNVAVSDK